MILKVNSQVTFPKPAFKRGKTGCSSHFKVSKSTEIIICIRIKNPAISVDRTCKKIFPKVPKFARLTVMARKYSAVNLTLSK